MQRAGFRFVEREMELPDGRVGPPVRRRDAVRAKRFAQTCWQAHGRVGQIE